MIKRKSHVKRVLTLSLLTGICCFPVHSEASSTTTLTKRSYSIESVLQNRRISGIVKDNLGAVIGANVSIKGTTIGAITDMNGKFSFDAPNDGILVISFIGYTTQEMPIKGKSEFIVTLKEDAELLDEVVVVGYGTQKKVNLSGSVSAIEGEQIASKPSTDVMSALQGEMPGVTITRGSGQPGAEGAGVQIRGFSSVNDTKALVLIDGVEGDMSMLNADDIESISVLKDAASCAIYGARAAAGVILVTTKNGTITAMYHLIFPVTCLSVFRHGKNKISSIGQESHEAVRNGMLKNHRGLVIQTSIIARSVMGAGTCSTVLTGLVKASRIILYNTTILYRLAVVRIK